MKYLLLAVISAFAAYGQGRPYPAVSQVRPYLELTETQVQSIARNNAEYNTFNQGKQSRVGQVQREIAQLTLASPLDPLGLGLRYAEAETICRQLKDKANEIYGRNVALLTDAQKAKLKALEEAMKLLPIYNEARETALTGPFTGGPPFALNTLGGLPGVGGISWTDTSGFLVPGLFPACQSYSTAAFRTGDFSLQLP